MRVSIIALALSALVNANPLPQNVELDLVPAAPELERRGNCAAQPAGAKGAPTYSPDTATSFSEQTSFGQIATAADVPNGYSQVFSNLNASNNAYGYLGYTNVPYYDSCKCADKCNAINGCMGFNIYFERDPSLDPGSACPNPSSVTMIKCAFWGGPISASNADNYGQWRDQFQVVIAGSNGYMNNSLSVPSGYSAPTYLGDAAINAPLDSQGNNTYLGVKIFPAAPFKASLCADYCTSQSEYNLAHPPTDGSPVQTCQFFNTYLLYVNKTSNVEGQFCAIYSEAWPASYATNRGQYRGSDHYKIEYSYTFTVTSSSGSPTKKGASAYQVAPIYTNATSAGLASRSALRH